MSRLFIRLIDALSSSPVTSKSVNIDYKEPKPVQASALPSILDNFVPTPPSADNPLIEVRHYSLLNKYI